MRTPEPDPLIASGVDYLNVVISRTDVEANDIHETLHTLRQLIGSPERVRQFRHRVSVFIDGFNTDDRELCEIPAVRTFIASLDELFPYWFWFLDHRTPSLLMVAASCCDLHARRDSSIGHIVFEPVALAQFAVRHFDALNRLAAAYDIPEDVVAEISDTVATYFGWTA